MRNVAKKAESPEQLPLIIMAIVALLISIVLFPVGIGNYVFVGESARVVHLIGVIELCFATAAICVSAIMVLGVTSVGDYEDEESLLEH